MSSFIAERLLYNRLDVIRGLHTPNFINLGAVTINSIDSFPVDRTGSTRSCLVSESMYDFVYNRIHYYSINAVNLPFAFNYKIDFGNIVGDASIRTNVWNAFKQTAIFDQTIFNGQLDNVSYEIADTTLLPLQKTLATFKVLKDGDVVINGEITADWDIYSNKLAVTGERIILIHFMPQGKYSEGYEYLTSVIDTYRGEQRISLRESPLVTMSYEYILRNDNLRVFYNLFKERLAEVIAVPYFADAVYNLNITQGDLEIQLPQSATFNVNTGLWLIYKNDDIYEVIHAESFIDNKITLALGVSETYNNVLICPIATSYITTNISSEGTYNIETLKTRYAFISEFVTSGSYTPVLYKTFPIYTDNNFTFDSFSKNISQDMSILSSPSRLFDVEVNRQFKTDVRTLGFIANTSTIDNLRNFLNQLKGSWKCFWLPTHTFDFKLSQGLTQGNTTINITANEQKNIINENIYILYKDGDYELHKISNVVNGVATLDNSTIQRTASINEVAYISRLNLVRFASDGFKIDFETLHNIKLETSIKLLVDEEIDA